MDTYIHKEIFNKELAHPVREMTSRKMYRVSQQTGDLGRPMAGVPVQKLEGSKPRFSVQILRQEIPSVSV